MCGLFGFLSLRSQARAEADRGDRGLNLLSHRGPDQHSRLVDDRVYLGHRRLSILDLTEAGRQPMVSHDGQCAVTVNGEIYNYRKLRELLGPSLFRSNSDSEVVLHGYRLWGIDRLLAAMDGMYAVAIHDRTTNRVILARDRVGIKPLYIASTAGHVVWSSELKAIEGFLDSKDLEFDNEALYDFLTYRYVPAPKSMYKSVRKLLPGSYCAIDLDNGQVRESKYWQLSCAPEPQETRNAAEHLRELIDTSVCEQLVSDVPLGTFLSGGVDSSIVTYHASRLRPSLHTFSIGFDVPAYDETSFANEVALALGTHHHVSQLKSESARGILEIMRDLYGEPFGDYSAIPTLAVSKLARSKVTVALSGDGGDELFGGYPWYQRIPALLEGRGNYGGLRYLAKWARYRKRSGGFIQRALNKVALTCGMDLFELYVVLMNGVPVAQRLPWRRLLEVPADYDDYWLLRRYYRPEVGLRRALQFLDFHTYLPDDVLTKVDRASMAFSLECRVPLLSKDIIEFAFSLPESFIYSQGRLKGGLKSAYQGLLPTAVLERPKKGFGIPVLAWGVLEADVSFEFRVLRHLLEHSHNTPPAALLGAGSK